MAIQISAGECLNGKKIKEFKEIVFGVADTANDGNAFRQKAVEKLSAAAEKIGANAVVNFSLEVYPIGNGSLEATAYGNAVFVEEETLQFRDGSAEQQQHVPQQRVNLEAFMPKQKIEGTVEAEIVEVGEYTFAVCPKCKSKYKVDVDQNNGEVKVKGFDDVDDIEPGLQIYCLRCGQKFTVPDTI